MLLSPAGEQARSFCPGLEACHHPSEPGQPRSDQLHPVRGPDTPARRVGAPLRSRGIGQCDLPQVGEVPVHKSLHETDPGNVWIVCPHDEPMTSWALEQVMVKFSASDKKIVDEVFANKRRHLRVTVDVHADLCRALKVS